MEETNKTMNEITIVILEDDKLFQIKLEFMLNETEFRIIKIFESTIDLYNYIATIKTDIIISDIYIGKNAEGMNFIRKIYNTNIPIICITSSQEDKIYKEIDEYVAGYLIKPFHKITLLSTLRKVIKEHNNKRLHDFLEKKHLMITGKSGKLEKVDLMDIIYLEASGNYTAIITQKAKYVKKISLKKIQQLELDTRFRRIHSKYIINAQMIKSITNTSLTLTNDKEYPISRKYKRNIKEI